MEFHSKLHIRCMDKTASEAYLAGIQSYFLVATWYLLFRKIGIVVPPLHLPEVLGSLSEPSVFPGELFVTVDALPPLRIRRRFAPIGPGKVSFPETEGPETDAMTADELLYGARLKLFAKQFVSACQKLRVSQQYISTSRTSAVRWKALVRSIMLTAGKKTKRSPGMPGDLGHLYDIESYWLLLWTRCSDSCLPYVYNVWQSSISFQY
jgi:hypothetical protein